jgi:hypothetical protein
MAVIVTIRGSVYSPSGTAAMGESNLKSNYPNDSNECVSTGLKSQRTVDFLPNTDNYKQYKAASEGSFISL